MTVLSWNFSGNLLYFLIRWLRFGILLGLSAKQKLFAKVSELYCPTMDEAILSILIINVYDYKVKI